MDRQSDHIKSLLEELTTSLSTVVVNSLVKSPPQNATPRCSRSIIALLQTTIPIKQSPVIGNSKEIFF